MLCLRFRIKLEVNNNVGHGYGSKLIINFNNGVLFLKFEFNFKIMFNYTF
jgi:hypothetical protein